MSIKLASRVDQQSTTTGTGTLSLSGTVLSTYVGFVNAVGSGKQVYYCAVNRSANEWEEGIGTITSGTPDTLSRDRVLGGSSGVGTLVSFSAGTKDIRLGAPAQFGQQIQSNMFTVGAYL